MAQLKFKKVSGEAPNFLICSQSENLRAEYRTKDYETSQALAALCGRLSCEQAVRLCDMLEAEFNLIERHLHEH